MLVNDRKLEEVVNQINSILSGFKDRIEYIEKELADAKQESRPKASPGRRKRVQQTEADAKASD